MSSSNSKDPIDVKDFNLLEIVGTGSYSIVYRARHKQVKERIVAIKTVERQTLSSSSKENLLVEIKLLKHLNHKYIVGMYDFFWDDKTIFIVMEYCDGGNLSRYIKKHTTLPEKTCKFFHGQLAQAVEYMHSHNKLPQVVGIFQKAVEEDSKLNYPAALELYSKGLEEFLEIIFTETEQVKPILNSLQQGDTGNTMKQDTGGSTKTVIRHFTYSQLHEMCTSGQPLVNALEIGRQGELYAYEKNFQLALENITASLSMLVPLIHQEPVGARRDMLNLMTNKWLCQAEEIKKITTAEDLENVSEATNQHSCCIQ